MKRLIVTFCLGLIVFVSQAQDIVIKMQLDGGVYKIPCTVNGCTMKFIFDTGASSVSMSLLTAIFLMDNDYIRSTDIVGSGSSSLADGSIVDHTVIILRDIEIGGLHLKNIRATVIESLTAPLLLGQSAIQKLGKIEMQGSTLRIKRTTIDGMGNTYINTPTVNDVDAEYKRLDEKAWGYYKDHLYAKACEYFEEINRMDRLDWQDVYAYAISLWKTDRNEDTYRLISRIEDFTPFVTNCKDIYNIMGIVCQNLKRYDEAIAYYELDIKKRGSCMTWEDKKIVYQNMGNTYWDDRNYTKAYNTYYNSLKCYADHFGISLETLVSECNKISSTYRNDDVDKLYCNLLIMYCGEGKVTDVILIKKLIDLANNSNSTALKALNGKWWENF